MKSGHRAIWIAALAVAVLWPSRVLSSLDGMPLNGAVEAVCVGVILPALVWLCPRVVERTWARVLITVLILIKVAGSVAFAQHGLCARFSTVAPFDGVTSTIDIAEPLGYLRSWDVRADWSATSPRCTAVFDRAYSSRDAFPIWFVNLLNALRPETRSVHVDVEGFVNVEREGTFTLQLGDDMFVDDGRIGAIALEPGSRSIMARLDRGFHALQLRGRFEGMRWQFIPRWNGGDAFAAGILTASARRRWDTPVGPLLAWLTTLIVGAILVGWTAAAVRGDIVPLTALSWTSVASVTFAAIAGGHFDRFAPLLLAGAALIPIGRRHRTMRAAFVMLGIPWLALAVAHVAPQLGRVTIYSVGDDWHMFQSAGYSIVLNGQWFRGGSAVFVFQALYRWIAGILHVIFGDPSPGDMFWDAACLLGAALGCYALVKPVSGFRAAIAGAALTLATFTISPIWYLIGRGLSEITAVGCMAWSLLFVLRSRLGSGRAAAIGGVFAALMYLTRMDRLLMTVFLLVGLLPRRTASAWDEFARGLRLVRVRSAIIYASFAAPGLLFLATRTWWYTGHFSILYGSSFAIQQTGLWPWTIASPAVWARVAESLAGTLSMREPPAFDPRMTLLVVGAFLSVLAIAQVPWIKQLPAPPAILTCGALAGAFFAHTHEYAGRISIHIVPFAVAMLVCAASRLIETTRSTPSRAG